MSAGQVETWLVDAVPELEGRIGTALQFSHASRSGSLGQAETSAYLLPLGLRGGPVMSATGIYAQAIDRMLGVLLVKRAISDPLGSRVVDSLEPMIEAVIGAIAGRAPDDEAIGVYRFARGELVGLEGGVATFQLDFILDDQVRFNR